MGETTSSGAALSGASTKSDTRGKGKPSASAALPAFAMPVERAGRRKSVRSRKYVFHYNSLPIYWTYARSIKGALRRVNALGMDVPACVEDCHGPEIWWREDAEMNKAKGLKG